MNPMDTPLHHWLLLLSLLLLSACSQVPELIRKAPVDNPMPAEVQQEEQRFIGSHIRWGGSIVQVENKQSESWIEVVGRRLGTNGKPVTGDTSLGRFIAVIPGFIEPTIYQKDRLLTVYGKVEKTITRTVGDYDYLYPVIMTVEHYLWEKEPPYYDYPPYWYDPWYRDPFWPYYPRYPYYW